MPYLQRGDASIFYEEYGAGYPVLLFSPGSLNSTIDAWHRARWDPTQELAGEYRVIAMDQRNAGRSRAPISAADNWETFLADHLALLDHLRISRCHVMGACIGVSFALRLIQERPDLVSAAVMQQPIGANAPRTESSGFDSWRAQLTGHPEAADAVMQQYHENLYGPLFVYSVSRDFVRSCTTPMVILPGNDQAHPYEIADELARLAPDAEFIPEWREGPALESAFQHVREFLRAHTPVARSGVGN
jgi:pimeloyl-ACP methyl ester carboxylesterase